MPKPVSGALWSIGGGIIGALLDATHDGKFDTHGLHKVILVGMIAGLGAWWRDQTSLAAMPPIPAPPAAELPTQKAKADAA